MYEYVVIYKNPKPALFTSPRGRKIKQTLDGAKKLVQWARSRGYDVKIQYRVVGAWHDMELK